MLIGDVRIEIQGPLLDALYRGICHQCGEKDFGYMVLTALRWQERHLARGHTVELSITETTPLQREKILKKIRHRGKVSDIVAVAAQAATL